MPVDPKHIIQRDGKDYVLFVGLLNEAHGQGLKGITTTLVQIPSELNMMVAICHATVHMADGTFSGIGDASPANVTRMLVPAIIRMAETRAVARALRFATNIGVTAFEELGGDDAAPAARTPSVAVRGGERVDEDAGRFPGTGTAAPRPVGAAAPLEAPDWPGASVNGGGYQGGSGPTDKQRQTLHKFGVRELPEGMTRKEASDLITQKIDEANARQQGRG